MEKYADASLPINRKVLDDKVTRAITAGGKVGALRLHLPSFAPWLAEFMTELLGFPSAKYDDQVHALTQLIAWAQDLDARPKAFIAKPIIVTVERRGFP